jgi:hypothetical protein
MKLSKFKNMAMIGAMSIAGVGLVGVGAHATFSTATTSSQQITTGTPGVALTAPGATLTGVGSDCTNTGEACGNITLAPVGPTGSSFTSGDQLITISNIGNIPLTELVFTVSSTYPTSALATEAYVCIASTGIGTHGNLFEWFNGPISTLPAGGWGQQGDTLTTVANPVNSATAAPTDNYIYDVYAGPAATAPCGGLNASPATGLNPDAEGQSINLSATMTYSG